MTQYQVKKITTKTITCPECGGDGWTEEKHYHNRYAPETCEACQGTGKKEIHLEEWVDLYQALIEIKHTIMQPKTRG